MLSGRLREFKNKSAGPGHGSFTLFLFPRFLVSVHYQTGRTTGHRDDVRIVDAKMRVFVEIH